MLHSQTTPKTTVDLTLCHMDFMDLRSLCFLVSLGSLMGEQMMDEKNHAMALKASAYVTPTHVLLAKMSQLAGHEHNRVGRV